jgi:hypothetical protein
MGGAGKADVRVGGSAIFEADGVNNYLFMKSTADATMTVNGKLYLGNTNAYTSFEKSSLSIGATVLPNKNNLTFGDNGKLYLISASTRTAFDRVGLAMSLT